MYLETPLLLYRERNRGCNPMEQHNLPRGFSWTKGFCRICRMGQTLWRNIHFEVHMHFTKIRVPNFISYCPGISPFSCSMVFIPWCWMVEAWRWLTRSTDDRDALEGQLTWKNFRCSSASSHPSRAPSPRRRVLDFSLVTSLSILQDFSRELWCFACFQLHKSASALCFKKNKTTLNQKLRIITVKTPSFYASHNLMYLPKPNHF